MPLFKVWSGDRNIKKCVIANSLDKFIGEAKKKLGIAVDCTTTVVLNDGTEVDEDDILLGFAGEVFLLLCNGETWTSEESIGLPVQLPSSLIANDFSDLYPVVDPSMLRTPSSVTVTEGDGPISIASPSSAGEEDSASSSVTDSDTCDSKVSDITRRIKMGPLPRYSPMVLHQLSINQPESIWSKFISETANHYFGLYPGISDSANYKLIGQRLLVAYPCISHDGNNPWSLVVKSLSQKIRHIRHNVKTKSQGASRSLDPPPKRLFHTAPKEAVVDVVPDAGEEKRHMEEMDKEWAKMPNNRSESHIKMLMKFTKPARDYLKKRTSDGHLKSILEEFPCLAEGCYLLFNLSLILGAEKMERLQPNIERMRLALEDATGWKFEGPFRYLEMLKTIEEETKIVRGKGKTQHIVEIIEDVQDADVEKHLATKPAEAPHVVVFKSSGQCSGIFVVGGGITINANSTDCRIAAELLLAFYYVFDLDYPRMYAMVLGILQTFVLNDPYRMETSHSYKFFIKKLRKSFDSIKC